MRLDQPTTTGRTHLTPDSIQPLFACDDCNFSSGERRAGPQNFFLVGAERRPKPGLRSVTQSGWSPVTRSACLNLDLLCCFLRFRSLGEGYREQPFLEAGLDLIDIDPLGHLKGTLK